MPQLQLIIDLITAKLISFSSTTQTTNPPTGTNALVIPNIVLRANHTITPTLDTMTTPTEVYPVQFSDDSTQIIHLYTAPELQDTLLNNLKFVARGVLILNENVTKYFADIGQFRNYQEATMRFYHLIQLIILHFHAFHEVNKDIPIGQLVDIVMGGVGGDRRYPL
jgi:hypothetical protein